MSAVMLLCRLSMCCLVSMTAAWPSQRTNDSLTLLNKIPYEYFIVFLVFSGYIKKNPKNIVAKYLQVFWRTIMAKK